MELEHLIAYVGALGLPIWLLVEEALHRLVFGSRPQTKAAEITAATPESDPATLRPCIVARPDWRGRSRSLDARCRVVAFRDHEFPRDDLALILLEREPS